MLVESGVRHTLLYSNLATSQSLAADTPTRLHAVAGLHHTLRFALALCTGAQLVKQRLATKVLTAAADQQKVRKQA